MKYLAAYLLCTMGGNKSPTAKDIENVLGKQYILLFFKPKYIFDNLEFKLVKIPNFLSYIYTQYIRNLSHIL